MDIATMMQSAALDGLRDAARDAHQAGDVAGALALADRWRHAILECGIGCQPARGGIVALSHARHDAGGRRA